MIILQIFLSFFLVILALGLIGGLIVFMAMFHLKRKMQKAFKNASGHPDPKAENQMPQQSTDDVEMAPCPHCGVFLQVNAKKGHKNCPSCGQAL